MDTKTYSIDVTGAGPFPTPNLTAARLKVMEAVPYLKKKSSEQLRYTFAGEADLIQKLRPEMVKHGIAVQCSSQPQVTTREYTTAKGAVMVDITGSTSFEFVHAASGERETHWVLAQSADSGDKAAGKWMTSALKYALRQFFLIETGDDPDEVGMTRHATMRPEVTAAIRAIAGALSEEALNELYQRFLVSEKANYSDDELALLERNVATRRALIKTPGAIKQGRK